MLTAPVTILGGLPVIAEIWASGPDHHGEYDCGVDALYWQCRDGSKGKEISQKIYDKLNKANDYWEADVTEQAFNYLSYEQAREADEAADYKREENLL